MSNPVYHVGSPARLAQGEALYPALILEQKENGDADLVVFSKNEKGKIVTEYVPAVFHRKASFGEPPTYKHPEPTEAEPEAPADVPPAA